jgi:hypothetical protein
MSKDVSSLKYSKVTLVEVALSKKPLCFFFNVCVGVSKVRHAYNSRITVDRD